MTLLPKGHRTTPKLFGRRPLWALLAAVCAPAAAVLITRVFNASKPSGSPKANRAEEPAADWCATGFEPIEGGGCFAASPETGRPLVVYLHGRYDADASADEVDRQRRLASHAASRRLSVLALRGRIGLCVQPELANWFCWPSNPRNANAAEAIVDSWTPALQAARQRAGASKLFLLGFSNGGYFAGLIASRGLLDLDALTVAHAGPVEPPGPRARKPPLLLLSADDDISQDDMIRFDEELTGERWSHDSYARFGGHALTDEDIDAALTFLARHDEHMPLDPPLPLHRPVHHDHNLGDAGDAGDAGEASAPVTEPDAESSLAAQPEPARSLAGSNGSNGALLDGPDAGAEMPYESGPP
jgi:predicted esterase